MGSCLLGHDTTAWGTREIKYSCSTRQQIQSFTDLPSSAAHGRTETNGFQTIHVVFTRAGPFPCAQPKATDSPVQSLSKSPCGRSVKLACDAGLTDPNHSFSMDKPAIATMACNLSTNPSTPSVQSVHFHGLLGSALKVHQVGIKCQETEVFHELLVKWKAKHSGKQDLGAVIRCSVAI